MHQQELRVHYLPQHVSAEALAGSSVVVIDVLRATSTICQALASGARDVVPFLEVDAALAAAASENRAQIVLGGERGGKRIDGFDLGNSPSEYTPQAVRGRRVFITTTNGTRAMDHARRANRIILGSFLNLSAVVEFLKNEPHVDILCAGSAGKETAEDILAAGAIAFELGYLGDLPSTECISDAAAMAAVHWSCLTAKANAAGHTTSSELALGLRHAPGGRNLINIGMDQDLLECAQIDRLDIVPELDIATWRITAKSP